MTNNDKNETYAVTPLQQGMLYNSLSAPNSGVEIEQILCTIKEPLDISVFIRAWRHIIDRHQILRTRFQWDAASGPRQIVELVVKVDPIYHSWLGLTRNEQNAKLKEFIHTDRLQDFNISEAPLMRLALFELEDSLYHCLWTFHHALLDGRSFPILLSEVFNYYEAYSEDRSISIERPRAFRDYVGWLGKRDLKKDETFWRQILDGFTSPTQISLSCSIPENEELKGNAFEEVRLSALHSSALQSFANDHDLTLNTLIHGAWALLLYHYSSEDDVVFGSTWSCRRSSIDGAESMVGLLINTLPMRVKIPIDQAIVPWLKQIRKKHKDLRNYLHTPLNKIQQWSNLKPGAYLFETLVVFENYLLNSKLRAQGGRWLSRDFSYFGKTSYPLTLAGYADNEILLRIEYHKDRFDQAAIKRMLGHIQTLLYEMIRNPNRPVDEIPYLTVEEKEKLLVKWNDTWSDYPRGSCIHELFEAQVEKNPNAVAVTFKGSSISYLELNNRSNQLANHLRSLGVKSESMVGLCVERSLDMIVGIIGILKAGGAYVPLEPTYPKERLKYMLEDTKAVVLITQEKLLSNLPKTSANVFCLDMDKSIIAHQSSSTRNSEADADSLAYVMYTSGSTGKPKGIEVTHRNVIRLVKDTNYVNLDKKEVLLLYAPISFDASTFEIWGALLNGGRLVICPAGHLTTRELGRAIKENNVTTVWLTAGLYHNIVENDIDCLLSVHQILAGGDVLSPASVKKVLKGIDGVCMVNGYGPTENTTFTCCNPMTELTDVGNSVSIGRPIANTKVYILDKKLKPVPIGVAGELCTSGDGIARGYLNRPELTAKAFIADPFSEDQNTRLYKTGDLARYLPDGNIEFLGRIDRQVKLRGYRIELGEIESTISMHPAISQVGALVREDRPGVKILVAYFIPEAELKDFTSELRKYLLTKLPEYMVPQYFIKLDTFPITPNGKIDRQALPAPIEIGIARKEKFVEARTVFEERMQKIWEDVLGIERISVHDNFFEIGGDSLQAVTLFSEIDKQFKINLPLATLFKAPTVEEMSLVIEEAGVGLNEIPSTELQRYVSDLSNVQKNIWSSLVKIQPLGNCPPFFCMHAVGGNVLNYFVFVKYLGLDQPLYGLQSRGLDGISELYNDIETMARDYISEICKVQPKGPYYLGGASMGGQIALEVAQQLKQHGEQIAFLAMFDTYGPGYIDLIENSQNITFNNKWINQFVNYHIPKLRQLPIKDKFEYFFRRVSRRVTRRLKLIICGIYRLCGYSIPHKMRFWYIEEKNTELSYKYFPKPYYGDVTLFSSSIEQNDKVNDPQKGWGGVIKGKIEVVRIEAEHYQFIESPMLGEKLNIYLKNAQKNFLYSEQ